MQQRVARARARIEEASFLPHLHPRDRRGKFRDSLGKPLAQAVVGDIVKPRSSGSLVRRRAELHVHRMTGGVEVRMVDDLEAAKADGRQLVRLPDVFRVDLHDPMRQKDLWSTYDEGL